MSLLATITTIIFALVFAWAAYATVRDYGRLAWENFQ
jgi:hypothetical protein